MSLDLGDAAPLVRFTLNGVETALDAPPQTRLSDALREGLGAHDVKVGCNAGDCGACTVLIDGAPFCACVTPLARAEGARVETLSGLVATDPVAASLADAFLRHGAAQCGICTPGAMVSAVALLRETPAPSAAQVETALAGVLCRCTGYRKIVAAVMDARPDTPLGGLVAEGGVGDPVARLDGRARVDGSEVFGDDSAPAGALVVRAVRSPFPRAAFRLGDLEGWRAAHPGIVAVLTAADVPGLNRFGVIPGFIDQPVFAEDETRFEGEAVAAVAGEAGAVSALDLADFPVVWERLEAAMTPAAAKEAPPVHEARADNVMCRGHVARGDAAAGLAASTVVVEGAVETAFVEHAYIEPEAGWARRVGDRVEVTCCTQAPMMNRDSLAAILGLAPQAVRVIPTAVGGGFGSKLDLTTQPLVALAAWVTGRPVRMAFTRRESMLVSTKRHPASIRLRVGADAAGRLTGLDFDATFNTGAYASWGPTVANRVPVHASGPYVVPHYRADTEAVFTHCPPAGAFRGFGVPQAAAALEPALDDLAERLGMDRLAFRRLNALKDGAPTVTGQVFETGVGIGACFDALAPHWERALADAAQVNAARVASGSPLRRGVGVAGGWYGCGNTAMPNPSTIRAGLRGDGRVVLHQGAVDIGQGSNTVVTQIFAQALGAPLGAIDRVGADTDLTPDAGKTSASRQTFVTGEAARRAGAALRAAILRLGNVSEAAAIRFEGGTVRIEEGGAERQIDFAALPLDTDGYALRVEESYDPPAGRLDAGGQGSPYAQFGYAAQMVALDVDTGLGLVRPVKVTAAHDVGRAINPVLVEGQIHGGVAQGLGMALMEEFVPGRTDNLHDYLIPTIGDAPEIETIIVEVPDPHGPFGAKGLGEHALIPTAPAVLCAIRHATGAVVRRLPATPERVLAALDEVERAPW